MNQDNEHLDLLAVFHYVVAGMTALMACVPFIHVAMGIIVLVADFSGQNQPPPRAIGWLFVVLGGFFILLGWTLAVLILFAGRRIHRRTAWRFCFVVAAIECVLMPFGTVLGVFTLIVLSRQSVKELFGARPAAAL